MSYTAVSFVAFEVLTAAKMNIMAANDASFNDATGIATGAIKSTHIDWAAATGKVWWEELGRTTLGSAGDSLSLTGLTARKYLKILFSIIPNSTVDSLLRFNNDTGNNYSWKFSSDLAAVSSSTSQSSIPTEPSTTTVPTFGVFDVVNIAAKEKLVHGNTVVQNTAGAGTAPSMGTAIAKWANTSNQITRVDLTNSGAGDFDTGSQIVVLGHD